MFLQIKHVILWPHKTEIDPRVLNFEIGMVNVISGASKTGKSALVPIIDYCLGSDKCAIPVKTIRDACGWFGILVQTDEGQKLLARRNPGTQQSTGDMFVVESDVVPVPREIEGPNTTVDGVKKRLDELARLSNIGLDPTSVPGQTVRGSRPSFRDLMAFCFQPQNVVANQDLLFFKADTYEHREKLKAIFPYVLGALTPEILALRWELESLRRDFSRKERELAALFQASVRWTAELKSWVSRAREYGLLAAQKKEESTYAMMEVLREVVKRSSLNAAITTDSINNSVTELVTLERDESVIASELGALRRRQSEMARLRDTAQDYVTALKTQRERLGVATWLRTQLSEEASCPVCHEPMHEPTEELRSLVAAIDSVEQASTQFRPAPDAFEKEFHNTRELIRTTVERLTTVRDRKNALAVKSEDVRRALYRATQIDRFLGQLDQALSTYDGVTSDNELVNEVLEMRERIKALQARVAELEIKKREQAALSKVSTFAGRLIPKLDSERPNDVITLSVADLTVKVGGAERDDFLFEIGSGANWLSYHVAVTLALQQLFISQVNNPVPGFVVYDQPSQVYFPRRMTPRKGEGVEDLEPKLLDEDVAAVRRVFEVLGDVVTAAKGMLQVIVLDHADQTVWGEIENVALVEEWRGGTKLVPPSWLDS